MVGARAVPEKPAIRVRATLDVAKGATASTTLHAAGWSRTSGRIIEKSDVQSPDTRRLDEPRPGKTRTISPGRALGRRHDQVGNFNRHCWGELLRHQQSELIRNKDQSKWSTRTLDASADNRPVTSLVPCRTFQRLVGDFVGEDLFFSLVDRDLIHGIDPFGSPAAPAVSRQEEKLHKPPHQFHIKSSPARIVKSA